MRRPIIAITMGDPSGIGPEIIMKALGNKLVPEICRPLVIGDAERLRGAGALVGSSLEVRSLAEPQEARFNPEEVECIDLRLVPPNHPFGTMSALSGDVAYRCIERAVKIVESGHASAICTAPLSKEALHAAGHKYPGHTEMLAELTGARGSVMLLAHGGMRVSHVSTHVALEDVPKRLTPERLRRVIDLTHDALIRLGAPRARIAVAALNPHAGEGGLFGWQDIDVSMPTIAKAVEDGLDVVGPIPGDTIFVKLRAGQYDAVVAMYHDQGHIPVKLLGFEIDPATGKWRDLSGVNITLGLPIIRTSVDHGTAFDIAGKGIANEHSLVEAIEYAELLASHQPKA